MYSGALCVRVSLVSVEWVSPVFLHSLEHVRKMYTCFLYRLIYELLFPSAF